ncbi:hypothetical protein [Arthrobacter bambusae]|uniref:Uncharacterized protein n=1 Tax=Arthrobacter bambusae TaxID=1338426 RepID=A0AAW8DF00_9MICC|nr:hypothetical protein [Arthrobacter bambusae]MDP9903243.1 hypothetical protein [Arthrobacter bambusae]MDQ0128763.1 hypothetical protein [Arthrobacter bambusae]MDQ0180104.1 hypothetical protein [Arthrobacter bambusae]
MTEPQAFDVLHHVHNPANSITVIANASRTVVVMNEGRTIDTGNARADPLTRKSTAMFVTPEWFAQFEQEIALQDRRAHILGRTVVALRLLGVVTALVLFGNAIWHVIDLPWTTVLAPVAIFIISTRINQAKSEIPSLRSIRKAGVYVFWSTNDGHEMSDDALVALEYCRAKERDALFELTRTDPPADKALLAHLIAEWLRLHSKHVAACERRREQAAADRTAKSEALARQKLIELGLNP